MIIFHHTHSKYSNELKERFDRLSLNYKIVEQNEEEAAPFIVEDDEVYKDKNEIEAWFQELEDELNWQRSISGDGCYIDPKDGKIC